MNVEWLESAEADFDAIIAWYLENFPEVTNTVAAGIWQTVSSLRSFASRGRPGLLEQTRELLVPGLPYLLVYVLRDDCVALLRILHQHQQWPPE